MIEQLKAKLDELQKAMAEKTASKEEISALQNEVKELNGKIERAYEVPGYKEEKQKFSFAKATRAALTKDWTDAGFEKEVSDSISKSINVDTGSEGGYLAPVNEMQEIIGLARAGRPILNQVGIRKISGMGAGELTMNKVTSGNTAYWGGSEASATESDMALGQISLKPHYLRAWTTLSRELLKQTTVGVESLVREELGYAMSKKLEQAALYGTGLADEPKGVVKYSSINTVALGTNGALPTFDDIDDLRHELEKDDTFEGNIGVVTSPQIAKVLRQSKIAQYSGDTGGEYYIMPGQLGRTNEGLASFIGMPFYTSTLVPVNLSKGSASNCSYIVLGDWSQMVMATWGGLEIRVSEQAATPFKQNQVLIAAFSSHDFNLRRENSFAVISDAKIA